MYNQEFGDLVPTLTDRHTNQTNQVRSQSPYSLKSLLRFALISHVLLYVLPLGKSYVLRSIRLIHESAISRGCLVVGPILGSGM